MNAIENRQHYVFLDCSSGSDETAKEGDEAFNYNQNLWYSCKEGDPANSYRIVRRPVPSQPQQAALTEQRTDGMTVWDHYAIEAFKLWGNTENAQQDIIVGWCKLFADAMMKARPK